MFNIPPSVIKEGKTSFATIYKSLSLGERPAYNFYTQYPYLLDVTIDIFILKGIREEAVRKSTFKVPSYGITKPIDIKVILSELKDSIKDLERVLISYIKNYYSEYTNWVIYKYIEVVLDTLGKAPKSITKNLNDFVTDMPIIIL
ncbi:hypothetical protein GE21DRAFT_1269816 [Neurospora crassa]|nr:hypothetical protein GE21DRAFT_1269816 [Neurospora crassa]